ncbi:MAG: squalene synthase HpnC [Burkholderiaceae bacterium]|jgi:squalene synthase HpnC|nr:squalene synthase HpnC [Polynucleobacter sp.]
MTNAHYENFPVASPLLPPELRAPVRVIYAFARSADDLADEGDASASERIEALNAYERELDHIDAGREPSSDLFLQLALTLKEHHLNTQLLRDLLSAFRQDVVQTRYASFDELLDYCSRSANPVGRIMLALSEQYSPEMLDQSDAICSALQLINFLQDVAIDRKKSRIYIPQEDIAKFSVSEQLIAEGKTDHRWRALMQFQVARARSLMLKGAPLATHVGGRLGWELRFIVHGGLRILEKIEAVHYDVFNRRPTLKSYDWLLLGWRALRYDSSLAG